MYTNGVLFKSKGNDEDSSYSLKIKESRGR